MAEKQAESRSNRRTEAQQNKAGWKVQKRSQIITRRFDFPGYDEMRDFLDHLETLSESENYCPDLTFSRTHVNVSIYARGEELAQVDFDFSNKVDALADVTTLPGKLE